MELYLFIHQHSVMAKILSIKVYNFLFVFSFKTVHKIPNMVKVDRSNLFPNILVCLKL
jgi:hypothetical protein